jgi:hypothetical protein
MPIAIPNTFLNHSPDPISKLDQNFTTLQTYLNAREATPGLIANRPAAGNLGALFLATDVFGGTLYLDNGSTWVQVASGVLGASNSIGLLVASARGGGF